MFVTIASSEVSTSVTENTDKEIQLHVHVEQFRKQTPLVHYKMKH